MWMPFLPDELEFSQKLRALLASEGAQIFRVLTPGVDPDPRPLYRFLGERNLLAPDWKAEHGGLGLGAIEAGIVAEELARAGFSDTLYILSIQYVGHLLRRYGTNAQQHQWLPGLGTGLMFA